MKSYAVIDRIENQWVVFELELVSTEKSLILNASEKETTMIDVELSRLTSTCKEVEEGDVFLVEHDNTNIITIYGKDENEKNRRIQLIQEIMKR